MALSTDKAKREPTTGNGKERDRAAIERVIAKMSQAIRNKDVEAMLELCTPDFITFDLVAPIQHQGADAIRRLWARTLEAFDGPIQYELQWMEIDVAGEVAFSRGLGHFKAKTTGGKVLDNWLRFTHGFRKVDGEWKVAHEHVSVPFDMETGKALLELRP